MLTSRNGKEYPSQLAVYLLNAGYIAAGDYGYKWQTHMPWQDAVDQVVKDTGYQRETVELVFYNFGVELTGK